MRKKPIKKRSRKKSPPREKGPRGRAIYQKQIAATRVSSTIDEDRFLEEDYDGTSSSGFEPTSYQPISPAQIGFLSKIINLTNIIISIIIGVIVVIIALIYFFSDFSSRLTANSTEISNIKDNMIQSEGRTKEAMKTMESHFNNKIDKLNYDIEEINKKTDRWR